LQVIFYVIFSDFNGVLYHVGLVLDVHPNRRTLADGVQN
jgi:hypothetical protein